MNETKTGMEQAPNETEISPSALQEISQKYGITDPEQIKWIMGLKDSGTYTIVDKEYNQSRVLSGYNSNIASAGNPNNPTQANVRLFKYTSIKNEKSKYIAYLGAFSNEGRPDKHAQNFYELTGDLTPEEAQRFYEMYMDIRKICGIVEPIDPTKQNPLSNLPGYKPQE